MMRIRKATKKNIKELLKLSKKWYGEKITPGLGVYTYKELRKEITNNIILISEERNKIIGFLVAKIKKAGRVERYKLLNLKNKEKYCKIDSIYIIPKYRNKEIGKKLLRELLELMKKRKIDRILTTAVSKIEKHDSLVRFYKRFKFKPISAMTNMELK